MLFVGLPASDVVAAGKGGGATALSLSTPPFIFGETFGGKIEILCTYNLLLAAVCWNSVGDFWCLSENCNFLPRIRF